MEVPQISEKDRYRFLFSAMATSVAFLRMRFLDLSPEQMKVPSFPGSKVLGESGENLPSVLQDICADPQRKKVLAAWLRELTPMDARDFGFPRDAYGRVYLQIQEANGREVSAYSASDGTLRFLGMLAALLDEDYVGLYFFEEIDNGIHPARLHLLLDLIERQTAKGKIQVVATTHSPDVLNLINDTTFENTVQWYIVTRTLQMPSSGGWRSYPMPESCGNPRAWDASTHPVGWRTYCPSRRRKKKMRRAENEVLLIPEDFRNDQYILKPIFKRLFSDLGRPTLRVEVCLEPLLGGVQEALKSERLERCSSAIPDGKHLHSLRRPRWRRGKASEA